MMLRLGTPLPLTLLSECFLFSLHPLSFCFLLFGVHPLGILRGVVQQGANLEMLSMATPSKPQLPAKSVLTVPSGVILRTRWLK